MTKRLTGIQSLNCQWWTEDTSGAGDVGSVIHFHFRFNGMGPDFEVLELQTDSLVRWRHAGSMDGD